jgi:hypothetical protein
MLASGAVLLADSAAVAQQPEGLSAIQRALERQQQLLSAQERRIAEQERRLQAQQRQIEQQSRELQVLRGASPAAPPPRAAQPVAPPASAAAPPAAAAATAATAPIGAAAAQAQQRREEQRVIATDPGLARTGGVLTPRGTVSLEPSVEYSYTSQNRAVVSGFTIIPGITFGSVDIREVQRRTVTAALTGRIGVTDRLELNVRIPYVHRFDTVTTQPADTDASPITVDPTGTGLGDIEFGGSYQINDGREGWPVFIGNLRIKSITGRSPFEVPIFTVNDEPEGRFLRGLERELPTGTGFWAVEPGVTVVYPTDPAVLFASARYIWNAARTVNLPSTTGGAPTRANLDPGDGIGLNFGIGLALNETTSFSMGYEHVHALTSRIEGRNVRGSSYDAGTFNFGLSHRVSERVSLNLGFGVGVTETAPDLRVILRVPIRLQLF